MLKRGDDGRRLFHYALFVLWLAYTAESRSPPPPNNIPPPPPAAAGNRSHFVLVHGSCHGAWCWYKLKTLLEAAGHKVTAIDLGASGINPQQLNDIRSISDYNKPLYSVLQGLNARERVVLVGHSKGGLAVGAAMERFPQKIAVGCFLTAYMLGPNYTIIDLNRQYDPDNEEAYGPDSTFTYDRQGRITSILFGPRSLAGIYYLSPPQDLTLAKLLVRPYPYFDDERGARELTLTQRNYGSVKRVFIISGKDLGFRPLADIFIEKTPPDEVAEIPDSDHMVMFSEPQELSTLLQNIAMKYK